MSLSLAIPVRDDLRGLRALMERIALLGCVDEVLVFDDGSEAPVDVDALWTPGGPARDHVRILRAETSVGAGRGRNILCDHIQTSHVLFFDSDDLPTLELPRLLGELEGRQFDFCLFKHADTRTAAWGGWGQMPIDEAQWRVAGLADTVLDTVSPPKAALLAETANYPWNKIYRTDFLRDNATVRCFEIPVHNDVGLHWDSFLAAKTVLASARIAAQHVVAAGKGRLTNRTGVERLDVFGPLDQLAERILAAPSRHFVTPFFRFMTGLFAWIRQNLNPRLHPSLNDKISNFFNAHVPPGVFARVSREDPVLGLRICLIMEEVTA
jgi:hypothetical protein